MLLQRGGARFRWSSAAGWAATWALGAAAGVALGGYLTVTSGSGAPGAESLSVGRDLVTMPAAGAGLVFAVHLVGQVVAAAWRGRRAAGDEGRRQDDREQTEQ